MKTLQESILHRALGDKSFDDIYQQYKDARKRRNSLQQPTASQIALANLVKEFGATEAGRKAGVVASKADSALSRVARYEYITGNKVTK